MNLTSDTPDVHRVSPEISLTARGVIGCRGAWELARLF